MTKVKTTGGVSTRVGGGVTVKGRTPSSIKVSEDGAFKGTQPEINFTGDVTVTNDPANNRVNVDIDGGAGGGTWGSITGTLSSQTDLQNALDAKQAVLVSGTNIKTINSTSLLGSGNIAISANPGGLDTQVQLNDAGAFGGDAGLVYNKTTDVLTIAGGAILSSETALCIAHFDGSKQIKSLDTNTYPNLTELSYVKGGTSSFQTQINDVKTGDYGLEASVFTGLGGTVVLVNSIKYFRAKKGGTITGWSIVAEGSSPTCTIDIFKIATGTTLPSASITAAALPALATGNALKSTTLTGWTTSYSADDIFAVKITACANATKITFDIYS